MITEVIGDYSSEDSKFSSITSLRDVPEFAELLQSKVWFLLRAPSQISFFLSDDPVVKNNHYDYGPRGSLGLDQKGIEAYLPISPKLAIQFLCPEVAAFLKMTSSGQHKLSLQLAGKPLQLEDPNVVLFINSLQVIQSERFFYGATDRDFIFVKEMLQQDPDLAEPASSKIIAT